MKESSVSSTSRRNSKMYVRKKLRTIDYRLEDNSLLRNDKSAMCTHDRHDYTELKILGL